MEKSIAEKYGVSGYPTLKILRYGKRSDYDGPRDADGIVKFMLEQSKSAAQEVRTVSEARKFMLEDDVTIIGFFASLDSVQFQAFSDAAEGTRNEFTVGYTTDPSVFKEYKAKPNDIIIFYPKIFHSKFEEKTKTFNQDEFTAEDLLAFYRENAVSLVGLRTHSNVATRYGKTPLVVVYYSADFSHDYREGTQFWRNKILPVANKYKKEKYRFSISNEEEFAQELLEIGLGDSGLVSQTNIDSFK